MHTPPPLILFSCLKKHPCKGTFQTQI